MSARADNIISAPRFLLLLLMLLVHPGAALADDPFLPAPPVVPLKDTNRVDVLTGSFQFAGPSASIGPVGKGGLSYDYFGNNQTGQPWISTVKTDSSNPAEFTMDVTLLGNVEKFAVNSDGTFSPAYPTGGSLTYDGSTTWTYVKADGTTAVFNAVNYCTPTAEVCTLGLINTITYASGESLTFTMRTTNVFFAIQSINSNLGYQIKVNFQCSSPTTDDCYSNIAQIIAINNAVDYCDPTANSCTGLTQSWPTLTVSYSTTPVTTSVTDSLGNTTNLIITVTTSAGTSSLQRPSGRHIDYENFTCAGCAPNSDIQVTDGSSTNPWTYGLATDPTGTILTSTVTDPLGRVRQLIAATSTGLPSSDTEDLYGLNLQTTYLWNGAAPTRVTFPEGNYVNYTYDARGNPTEIRKVGKPGSGVADIVTSATYTPSCTSTNFRWCNKPLTFTDPNGNTTTYTYSDDHGGVLTETGPAVGGVQPQTRYTYTLMNAWYKTGPPGPAWGSATWNSFNWSGTYNQATTPVYVLTQTSKCMTGSSCAGTAQEMLTVTNYAGGNSYQATNLQPSSVTQKSGNSSVVATVSSTYDSYGNVATKTDANGNASAYFYDLNRQQIGAISPGPNTSGLYSAVQTSYDIDGRVAEVDQGTTTSHSSMASFASLIQKTSTFQNSYFAPVTLETSFVGGLSHPVSATQSNYDDVRNPQCTAIRENMAVLSSLPDACSLSTAGSYGQDQIKENGYDSVNRLTTVQRGVDTSSIITEVTNYYTPNGKIDYLDDANGNRTDYTYDGQDRLVQLNFPSKTTPHTPSSTDYEVYGYDANGNRTSLQLRSGETITYTYDALNRQTLKHFSTTASTDVYSNYDLVGNQLYAHYSSATGVGIDYTWDALGRKLTETSYGRTVTSQYDPNGNRTRLTWPDSNYVQYTFDPLNRMQQVLENGSTLRASYSYDDLSRVVGISRSNPTATSMSYSATALDWSLTQDMAGTSQDVTYSLSFTPATQIYQRGISNSAYGYSAAALTQAYTSNGLNQYTSVGGPSYSYDARANLTSDGGRSFTYDLENHLLSVSGTYSMSLAYDPRGRMQQTTATSTEQYLYDGDDLLAEYDTSGNILRRYVPGRGTDEFLIWYEGAGLSTPNWLHTDQQGSTIAVSNSSGVATTYSYDPNGTPASWGTSPPTPIFRYTGQVMLPAVKLYYYKARIYDPTLGRFLQTDPVGYKDEYNLYAYVGNDPTNKTDPTGMVCNSDGTACTSDVAVKSTANVQNSPAMDQAMHDNAGQVRVGLGATHEKIGFIEKDNTFRNPSDAKAGSTPTQDNAKAGIQPNDAGVLHSHIPGRDAGVEDDTQHGRALGDAQPLTKGLTNGTVMGDRLGVHEQVNGQVQFRMIDGKMTPQEQKVMQRNLDDQQKLLNQ